MANAHPNIKAIANFETVSNDQFGVEVVLENLITENRKN
jgi:hydroxymethylpyrimidine pyrophosphatase-like HAD family hydrolase